VSRDYVENKAFTKMLRNIVSIWNTCYRQDVDSVK